MISFIFFCKVLGDRRVWRDGEWELLFLKIKNMNMGRGGEVIVWDDLL